MTQEKTLQIRPRGWECGYSGGMTTNHAAKFTRHAPGIYTDSTDRWVINRQGRNWYSIRRCLGYGKCLDGATLFPDMSGIWYGDYTTLADAKNAVLQMVADGFNPQLDWRDAIVLEENTEAVA